MEGIEFETDQESRSSTSYTNVVFKRTGMFKLLAKFGIQDTTMASYILLGIAAILLGVTIFLYAGALGNGSIVPSGPVPPGMQSL